MQKMSKILSILSLLFQSRSSIASFFQLGFLQALPYLFPWWPAEAGSHLAFPSIVNSLPQQETEGANRKWTYLSSHPQHSAVISTSPDILTHTSAKPAISKQEPAVQWLLRVCSRTCVRQHAVALESGHVVDAGALI